MEVFLVFLLMALVVTVNALPTSHRPETDPPSNQHHEIHQLCQNATAYSPNNSSTICPKSALPTNTTSNHKKHEHLPLDLVNAEFVPISVFLKQHHIMHRRDVIEAKKTQSQKTGSYLKGNFKKNNTNVMPTVIVPSNSTNTIWVENWKPYIVKATTKTKKDRGLVKLINITREADVNRSQSNDGNTNKPLFITIPFIDGDKSEDEGLHVNANFVSRKMNNVIINGLGGIKLDIIYSADKTIINFRGISDEKTESSLERPQDINLPLSSKENEAEDLEGDSDKNCLDDQGDNIKSSKHVGCVCALFDSDCPSDTDVPIISEMLPNITCHDHLSPEDVCKVACISHMLPLFSYNDIEMCSILGDARNVTVYLRSKMCEEDSEWNFAEISSSKPICCSENVPTDC